MLDQIILNRWCYISSVDSSAQPVTIEKLLAYACGENLRSEEIVGSRMSIHQKPVDHEIHRLKTQTKNYRPNTTSRGLLTLRELPNYNNITSNFYNFVTNLIITSNFFIADPSSSGAVPLEKQQDALMRNKNSLKYENQNPTMEKAKSL